MNNKNQIAIFQGRNIRKVIFNNKWWFAVEDVVLALTDSANAKDYINKLLIRDGELSKKYRQIVQTFEVPTENGKQKMNYADTEGLIRIIQSIPSSKVRPFKHWLKKAGYERRQGGEGLEPKNPVAEISRPDESGRINKIKEKLEIKIKAGSGKRPAAPVPPNWIAPVKSGYEAESEPESDETGSENEGEKDFQIEVVGEKVGKEPGQIDIKEKPVAEEPGAKNETREKIEVEISDSLNEGKLDKPESETLAAKRLPQDKNDRRGEIEIEEKIKVKTEVGIGKPASVPSSAKATAGEKAPTDAQALVSKSGGDAETGQEPDQIKGKSEGQKDSGARGGEEKGKKLGSEPKAGEGGGEKPPKEESDKGQGKEQPAGKSPAEGKSGTGSQAKGKPGAEKPAPIKTTAGQPEAKDEAEKQAEGGSGKDKEKPESEPNKEKPGEKPKEQGEGEEKKGEEGSGEKPKEQEKGGEESADEPGKEGGKEGDEKSQAEEKPASANAAADKPEAKKEFQAGGGKGAMPDSAMADEEAPDGAAGKLREERKNKDGEEGGDKSGAADEPQSLRQRVQAARQAMNLKEQAKKKFKEKVMAPAKQAISEFLKEAWLNLIDSFGLTLIWINIHVFLKWVLGEDLFCKLGEEWLPKQAMAAGGDATETASKGFGLLEVMVLLILDLIVLAVIFAALALIVMIVDFMGAGWWEKLKDLWTAFWTLGWGGIQALVDLFGKK